MPSDVTDLLLWRLAYDVAEAHQPDESGRCPNLLCDRQQAPCDALGNAERAMELARGGADAVPQWSTQRPSTVPAQPARSDDVGQRATRQAA